VVAGGAAVVVGQVDGVGFVIGGRSAGVVFALGFILLGGQASHLQRGAAADRHGAASDRDHDTGRLAVVGGVVVGLIRLVVEVVVVRFLFGSTGGGGGRVCVVVRVCVVLAVVDVVLVVVV